MNFGSRDMMHLSQERGNAVLELAVVLAVLMMVSFIGLELTRSLDHSQGASRLSREAASRAFRSCIGMYALDTENNPEARDTAVQCLDKVRSSMESFARTAFPDTEVVLSLYRYENKAPDCSNSEDDEIVRVAFAGGSDAQAAVFTSRFGFKDAQERGTQLRGALEKHPLCMTRAMVVSEVFVPYRATSGARSVLMRWSPEVFYSAAVM